MATYVCPVDPVSVWVPLDPTITELPEAPTKTVNPSPVPANTYPGTFTPGDFLLTEKTYGSVAGQNCVLEDWGLITATPTASLDYGGLLTIWDLLPTGTPAVPAEEIDTTVIYPPYTEYTILEKVVFAVCEVVPVYKTKVDLDIDPITTKAAIQVSRVSRIETFAITAKTTVDVTALGGAVTAVTRTKATVTAEYYTALGMIYGFEVT